MSPARLLEHFDRLIDTPDAVPRLRRFILDLAVRGKLVEQNPKDEPAGELLKRIQAEKARLMKAGEIRKEKPSTPIDDGEIHFEVPQTWLWSRLGVVAAYLQRGKSPKYAAGEGSLVVSQKCVQWDGLHLEWAKMITAESLADYEPIRFLRDGDLLWNSTGTGTIGRVIRLEEPNERLVCDSHVTVVRCLGVDERFIRTWLQSDYVYGTIEGRAAGATNQVELTASIALKQVTPIPPLAEQHRIVAKVDGLMALCDKLEAAQSKREKRRDRLVAATLHGLNNDDTTPTPGTPSTFKESARFYFNHLPRLTTRPEHIHQLRQTILNLAVRGMLVPQEQTGNITADSLRRIQAEKSRLATGSRLKKDKLLAGVPDDQLPFPIPGNWEWVKVGSLSLLVEYGTSVKSESQETGVPVLRMGDIQDGRVSLVVQKKVPRSIPDLPRLFLKHMDILYNRTNSAELVGKTGIFLGEDDKYTFASYLIRIRVLEVIADPTYVNLAMNAPYFRETQILPQLQQQCGQANVNGTKLRNMLIPLPPVAEQHRIVAKVDDLMALCTGVEAGLTSSSARSGKCLESMLGESLTGIATGAI